MLRDCPVPTGKCEEIGNNLHGLGFGAFSTILLLNPKLQAFVTINNLVTKFQLEIQKSVLMQMSIIVIPFNLRRNGLFNNSLIQKFLVRLVLIK